MDASNRRFVQQDDVIRETNDWTHNEWLCRPDLVAAEKLMMVRATMPAFHCHPFHYHPYREEIIYVLSGKAEQWIGVESRILGPGDIVHVPAGVVHATYNPFDAPLVFQAILSPAKLAEDQALTPDPTDVSADPQWAGLRKDGIPCRLLTSA